MDFSKFSQNEKLMVYGAVAAVIGGLVGGISGVIWISILAGLAMLVVLFLPQFSPQTKLPGSRGSLLVAIGGIGAVAAALAFLIGVSGARPMGWLAWQEFKAEGGKFDLGTASASAAGGTAAGGTTASEPAASEPPPAPMDSAPMDSAPTDSAQDPMPGEPRRDETNQP